LGMHHKNCETIQKWINLMSKMIDEYKNAGQFYDNGLGLHGRHHGPDSPGGLGDEHGWHSAV
jgi:hypothetical protein